MQISFSIEEQNSIMHIMNKYASETTSGSADDGLGCWVADPDKELSVIKEQLSQNIAYAVLSGSNPVSEGSCLDDVLSSLEEVMASWELDKI